MKNKAVNFLSKAQIREFTQPSAAQGFWVVLKTWLVIAATFALVAWQANPLTILFALLVLGSRQLSLAIIMHEASHKTLMPSLAANNILGQWFGAAPVVQDVYLYREHHMRHHGRTGTAEDPDLRLADGYPVKPASLARKLLRDLFGVTGIKNLIGSVGMVARFWEYNVSGEMPARYQPQRGVVQQVADAVRGLAPMLLMHGAMFLVLAATGNGWLYGLWLLALLTTYPLVLRVRSIAEHAMTTDPHDALQNSRTTYGRWWERQLFAPLFVNYHLEHHMLPTVPFYQLPKMHQALKQAGAFDHGAEIVSTYTQVMRRAASA